MAALKRWFCHSVMPILSKETRAKDSSLAAALKTAVFQPDASQKRRFAFNAPSRVLPILSKRPEIRIPAWRQLSKRWFSTRCHPKAQFVLKYAKPSAPESLKEARDKDSSLAALKRWFCQSRVLPILSKRPEIRIPAWRQLSKPAVFNQMPPKSSVLC